MNFPPAAIAQVEVSGRDSQTMLPLRWFLPRSSQGTETGLTFYVRRYFGDSNSASTAPTRWSAPESRPAAGVAARSPLDPPRRALLRHRVRVRLNRARLDEEMRSLDADED
jgi:hypothetical protein